MENVKEFNLDEAVCKTDYASSVVLMCRDCNTILGDSFGICGEYMNSIICYTVTKDVLVKGDKKLCSEGPHANCVFSCLQCSGCSLTVGGILHSTPPKQSALRGCFLLQKCDINCYKLSDSTTVPATTLNFDVKPLEEELNKLKQELESQSKRMTILQHLLHQERKENAGVNKPLCKTEWL
ncbi:protein Mis18-beta [Engraulis encrasicolus]|uniref:protein Mis18-beta n=1 Tax=Engraulis encrasicolus TaxID=184585 RepID=UPI002FD4777A